MWEYFGCNTRFLFRRCAKFVVHQITSTWWWCTVITIEIMHSSVDLKKLRYYFFCIYFKYTITIYNYVYYCEANQKLPRCFLLILFINTFSYRTLQCGFMYFCMYLFNILFNQCVPNYRSWFTFIVKSLRLLTLIIFRYSCSNIASNYYEIK